MTYENADKCIKIPNSPNNDWEYHNLLVEYCVENIGPILSKDQYGWRGSTWKIFLGRLNSGEQRDWYVELDKPVPSIITLIMLKAKNDKI